MMEINSNSNSKTAAWHSDMLRFGNNARNNSGQTRRRQPSRRGAPLVPQANFSGQNSRGDNRRRYNGNNRRDSSQFRPRRDNNGRDSHSGPTTMGIPAVRDKMRVIPLGGLGEIGKNMTAIEYNDNIVVLDAGTMFPDSYMFGIDYLIPNILYLEERKAKIKGIVFTHGHEDHIGAVPFIARKLSAPLYATPFTKGLIDLKLEEYGVTDIPVRGIKAGDVLKFGDIRIEAFNITHSVPDSIGFSIRTPGSHIIWTTDWKFDPTPVLGQPFETDKIKKWAEEGVDVLFGESTNVERPGHTVSEKDIGEGMKEIFSQAKGRIILATFASQIHRVYEVVQAAVATNRHIAFSGRSMVRNAEMAIKLGYINVPKEFILPLAKAQSMPDEKVLIVSTGSQGEEMSSLSRMAQGSHRQFKIKSGDTVILSASPIPGNEAAVGDVINGLFKLGAHVVYGKEVDVHVSGHAYRDELAEYIQMVKPKYFVPIHGEYRHLALHAELAQSLGIPKDKTMVVENGEILELADGHLAKSNWRAPAESILIDGLGIGDVGNIVLRDRQAMATDGIFVCIITVKRETHEILTSPDIISRGFVYMRAAEELIHRARGEVKKIFISQNQLKPGDWAQIKSVLRDRIGDLLFKETKRSPMVIPVIIEV